MRRISRRDFLKMGAASAAVLAMESQLHPLAYAMELVGGGRSVNRTSGLPRSFLPSTCTQCPAGCGIIGYVEESRLVKIGGNPKHISNQGALCARGQAGINALYDPDRLLQPLKRVGARGGSSSWTPISWQEAYDEVAARLNAVRSNPSEFVYLTDNLAGDSLGRRFAYAFGSANALGADGIYDANKKVATALTWGAAGDMPDLAKSKYVLVFGANPLENHPQFVGIARRLIDGVQSNQAKVVVFDVRLTNTSARANELHFVAPGTQALVALAMANVIMQEGLFDGAFIEQWTNVSPAQLAQHLAQYTPERAQAETGVSAQVIRRVATEFATTKPATTLSDSMLSAHQNGVQSERAVMLLNIITGNIDVRGGLCLPRQYELAEPDPVPAMPGATPLTNPEGLPFAWFQSVEGVMSQIKEHKQRVGVLMTHGFNPVYSNPDGGMVADTLKDETLIPFHVAVTPFMTETAALADLILPETTYLEGWEIETGPSPEQVPYVALRQPVVPALEAATPFWEIATELAKRLKGGMEGYFAFRSADEYLKSRIGKIGGLMSAGGLDYLKQHGVWYDPQTKPNYGAYQAAGLNTPSGRIEVFSTLLSDKGFTGLPAYEPVPAFSTLDDREMVLAIFATALHTDAKTGNCMWLNEIQHNNPVWINPETAKELGIKDGDPVRLTRSTKSGEAKERTLTSKAYLTEGIHPRVVAMAGGVGHTQMGRIAQGEKIKNDDSSVPRYLRDPNTELVWWKEHEGTGVNPKVIVPVAPEPIGGGQSWGDVVVTLAKA